MHSHPDARSVVRALAPDEPVILNRPHTAARAARFFVEKFPGRSLYAVKANPSPALLETLWAAGVTHYDVASLGVQVHGGMGFTDLLGLHFQFKREGIIRVIPGDVESARRMAKDRRRDAFWQRVCEVQELDAVPEAVVEVMPEPPDKLGAVLPEGRVVVDYFIDPEGKVRMPLIVRSDDEAFSAAVLLAITEWRYEPPKKQGVPVMTRVWRQFDFKPAQTVAKG